MSLKHEEIVIFFSKMVATVINWILIFVGIVIAAIVIWGFYIFLFKPYKPGEEPYRQFLKNNNKSSSSYFIPAPFDSRPNNKHFVS